MEGIVINKIQKYRKQPLILGKHLNLCKISPDQTLELYQQIISPGVLENLTIDVEKYEDFRQYILFLLNQWKLNQDLTYTIQLNSEYDKNRDQNPNHIIGQISLYNISFQHHRGEVGIWIGQNYWNHGYASEALQIIVKYAFDELHMNRLQAHIFTTNPSSKHIFEKIGFIKEGLNREYVSKQGTFLDVEHYALLYSDWIKK